MRQFLIVSARLSCALLALWMMACSGGTGPEGPVGPEGDPGMDGMDGDPGMEGEDGEDGEDGRNPLLIGPGLQIEIMDVVIDAEEVATLTYRITDDGGRALDLDGLLTEGAVQPSFVLAYLDENAAGEALQYSAYTTAVQTSPGGVSETQAAADRGGLNEEVGLGDGIYNYSFNAEATDVDRTKTHTAGIYATRNFEGQRYVSNVTFDFVPDGSPVTVTRDIVTTSGCNQCHSPLSVHGNRRRDVKLCILCHSPQSVDPDTGNTVDFKVMVHKIHSGHELPSVEAGGTYEIIGFGQSVHNYDTVAFPQPLQSCDSCHDGVEGDVWMSRPTRVNCRSCHDLTSFETEVPEGEIAHTAGPIPDDSACANVGCHPVTGGLAGVVDVHLFPAIDPATPDFVVLIDEVRNTAPGAVPEVDITVTVDGAGLDILSTPLNRLRFTIAGPTTDYEEFFQVTAQGGGAVGTITAIDAAAGKFTYSFPATDAIPVSAEGSYAVSIEARIPGPAGNVNVFNPVAYFAVTDEVVVPRRMVVDQAGCDVCHQTLTEHGGSRENTEYCVFCHNPINTNDERVANFEGVSTFVNSVDFKVMIHKIHRGSDLENAYVLGGFPTPSSANPAGSPIDFTGLRFPGDLRSCGTCHLAGSFELPLAANVLPSRVETLTCVEDPAADADEFCDDRTSSETLVPPTSAVCISCHDGESTAAHAEIMTTMAGLESCATCHGPGSSSDIAGFHRLDP